MLTPMTRPQTLSFEDRPQTKKPHWIQLHHLRPHKQSLVGPGPSAHIA